MSLVGSNPSHGGTTAGSTGRGSMAREDIAAVLLANFDAPDTGGQTFEIITGGTPISDA